MIMDKAEKLAYRWLVGQGYSVRRRVEDPPDFVVDDGKWAVEVTRVLKKTPSGEGIEYEMAERMKRQGDKGVRFSEPIEMFDFKGMPAYIEKTMNDKAKKVERSGKLHSHDKWWLILMDYYLGPLPYTDHEFVRDVQNQVSYSYPWSRVTLVHKEIFRPEVWFDDRDMGLDEPAPKENDFWTEITSSKR